MSVCLNHPEREATGKCATCFKPVCSECMVTHQGQIFCSELCKLRCEQTADGVDRYTQNNRSLKRRGLVKKLIIITVLIGIAVGAMIYLKNNPEAKNKLQQKIDSGKQQLQQQLKK